MIIVKFTLQWAGMLFVFVTDMVMRKNCGWDTETFELESTNCIGDDVGHVYVTIGFWAEFFGKAGLMVTFAAVLWVRRYFSDILP